MSITAARETPATIDTMDTADDLERRLDAGAWLLPAQVATLLGISKSTVVRMLNTGQLRYRRKSGTGRHRECDPQHVRELLAERRRVHGEQSPPVAGQPGHDRHDDDGDQDHTGPARTP